MTATATATTARTAVFTVEYPDGPGPGGRARLQTNAQFRIEADADVPMAQLEPALREAVAAELRVLADDLEDPERCMVVFKLSGVPQE